LLKAEDLLHLIAEQALVALLRMRLNSSRLDEWASRQEDKPSRSEASGDSLVRQNPLPLAPDRLDAKNAPTAFCGPPEGILNGSRMRMDSGASIPTAPYCDHGALSGYAPLGKREGPLASRWPSTQSSTARADYENRAGGIVAKALPLPVEAMLSRAHIRWF
jgi:hypothetical protein